VQLLWLGVDNDVQYSVQGANRYYSLQLIGEHAAHTACTRVEGASCIRDPCQATNSSLDSKHLQEFQDDTGTALT